MNGGGIAIIGFVLLLIVAAIVSPVFTIWSVNALFGTGVVLTLKSWASVFWLQILVAGLFQQAKSSK